MYKIYCLNNISPEGLALLTDNYEVIENIDEADAILVRSADMHEMEVPANLKAVARVTGNKRVSMLPQKELLGLTGYLRGGCSPIGMKKAFPTFVDASARNQEKISVSAGVRGCQVILATDQLLACVHGTLAELTQAAGE